MKIGLLSIFPYHNFGGILQLYALQRILKEKGHEAWAIKRQKGIMPFWRVPLAFVKRVILKYVFFREIDLFIERTIAQREKILYSNTSKFINKYIQPQTFPIYFKKDLIKMKKKYGFEGYVVGSDQVWRPKYLPVGLDEYFLSFTEDDNVIRVAYSASFGTDEWEYTKEQTEMSSRLAKKFNNVSVREKSAINLCKS
ncbi:MAG: polysaccharide pyruvyl transferase family protein, partial [Fibrobacter sp.]|nr:polysaccharide pyruvyl transferase family protein [Fibrobacter sp.]